MLIRVGLADMVRPKWSAQILDEVFKNLAANRPDLDPVRLQRTRRLMDPAIHDATVVGYAHLIPQLDLPDPDDRHVLAAAIQAQADVIVTKNLRDFPATNLNQWGMRAQHPDDFLVELHHDHPEAMRMIVAEMAHTWRGDVTITDVLTSLAVEAPRAANLLGLFHDAN